jgi:hypothetical protein
MTDPSGDFRKEGVSAALFAIACHMSGADHGTAVGVSC